MSTETLTPATQYKIFWCLVSLVMSLITDSSTFTFMSPDRMEELFDHEIEGCFLYSRHWNPTNKFLSDALARMEDSESAQAKASGMAAISSTIVQLCDSGDEIISSRTIYGGTYALFKNFLIRYYDPFHRSR